MEKLSLNFETVMRFNDELKMLNEERSRCIDNYSCIHGLVDAIDGKSFKNDNFVVSIDNSRLDDGQEKFYLRLNAEEIKKLMEIINLSLAHSDKAISEAIERIRNYDELTGSFIG